MTTSSCVLDALAEVHDPELDEPITSLGFVASCEVSGQGDVGVTLRLPTPQCAPNFAFLMAADARRVLRRLPGVREVHDLHIWGMSTTETALTAHLVRPGVAVIDDAFLQEAVYVLKHRFGIGHATLQLETGAPCELAPENVV